MLQCQIFGRMAVQNPFIGFLDTVFHIHGHDQGRYNGPSGGFDSGIGLRVAFGHGIGADQYDTQNQ